MVEDEVEDDDAEDDEAIPRPGPTLGLRSRCTSNFTRAALRKFTSNFTRTSERKFAGITPTKRRTPDEPRATLYRFAIKMPQTKTASAKRACVETNVNI